MNNLYEIKSFFIVKMKIINIIKFYFKGIILCEHQITFKFNHKIFSYGIIKNIQ